MSTIKVDKITGRTGTAGASSPLQFNGDTLTLGTINSGVSLASATLTGTTTLTGDLVPSTSLSHRNMIINGAMNIAQRGTSSITISAGGNFSCDRVLMNIATMYNNTSTIGQNLNSVTPPTGFTNYVGLEVDTATTVTGDAYYNIRHQIEGNNIYQLNFGSSNAKTITLSFWVRSSLTGTFSFSLRNGATDRSYVTTYTISSANTWEKKTITIAGDTTGTWYVDTRIGLTLNWGLGNSTGIYSTSTLNAWQSGSKTGATTGVDWVETVDANWYITGVQLELGSNATPFEHRSFGEELARCQRYYWDVGGVASPEGSSNYYEQICNAFMYNATLAFGIVPHPVFMRAAPTISTNAISNIYFNSGAGGGDNTVLSALTIGNAGEYNTQIVGTTSSRTLNSSGRILILGGSTTKIGFSSEL
jgi:hypothetical protein